MINHQLNVGFIGCGRIAGLHRLGYLHNKKAQLVALSSRNKQTLNKTAYEWGISQIYTDYREMLSNPNIDLIEVLTPHQTHFQISKDVVRAKKHLSLQKVPVMTLKEYDDLINIIKQNQVIFRVFENFRFHRPYARALELVKSGRLGQVKTVNQRMWASYISNPLWPYPLKSLAWRIKQTDNYASPTIFDDGFHKHSLAQMFLPEIKRVQVWCPRTKLKGLITLDLPSVVIYETNSKDTYGTWNVSAYPRLPIKSNYYACDELLEITLERGLIIVYGCTGRMFISPHSQRHQGIDWMDEKGQWHAENIPHSDWKYSFIESTQNFIDSILHGTKTHLDETEARTVLKITLAAVKSLKQDGLKIGTSDQEVEMVSP